MNMPPSSSLQKSELMWKMFLLVASTILAGLVLLAMFTAPGFFGPGQVGTLPHSISHPEPVLGSKRLIVDRLASDSQMAKAGIKTGDIYQWDHWYGTLSIKVGAPVGLTLISGEATRHVDLQTPSNLSAPNKTCYLLR